MTVTVSDHPLPGDLYRASSGEDAMLLIVERRFQTVRVLRLIDDVYVDSPSALSGVEQREDFDPEQAGWFELLEPGADPWSYDTRADVSDGAR